MECISSRLAYMPSINNQLHMWSRAHFTFRNAQRFIACLNPLFYRKDLPPKEDFAGVTQSQE